MTRRERRPNGTACTCSPAVGSQLDHVDVPSRQSGPHPRQPAVLAIKNVEDAFARLGYLAFYLAGGLVATMTQSAMTLRFGTASNPRIPNLRAEQSRPCWAQSSPLPVGASSPSSCSSACESRRGVGPELAAVVTSCTAELAQARISAAGIAAPNVVITVDQIARGKPDPEGFLLATHRLHVEPGLCLVVEDAPSGLVAARAAGCATITLTTTTPRSALVADLIVNSLANVRFETVRDGVRVAMAR
jgi:Haloacid dehalogenase-like hydrolase